MKRGAPSVSAGLSVIPDFCRAQAVALLVFLTELVAVVLSLAADRWDGAFAVHFGLLSLYLQIVSLSCAAVLCVTRARLHRAPPKIVFWACWGALLVVIAIVAAFAWYIARAAGVDFNLDHAVWAFVLRSVLVGAIVSLLLLRYFWDRFEWRQQISAEANARYLALQARIRPHFLFNALNSLAALVRTRPDKAEDMVLDLSDLFRASLDGSTRLITLREEVETVRGYLRIEEVRLGDRMMQSWDLPEELMDALLPRLILQPLVENAVLHGISRLDRRGVLSVIATRQGRLLVLDVENPLPPEGAPQHHGTGVAIGNIRERLRIVYGDRARLYLRRGGDAYGALYRARLLLPLQRHQDVDAQAQDAGAAQSA
ncbi:MAG TPA: histidine kinase [Nevskiaceae bacterium]|nr:histidine kinase [Nevskiaceae bacterium]